VFAKPNPTVNPRKRLAFGKAKFDNGANFAKTLCTIYLKYVLPLGPKKVIDGERKRYGVIVLGMLWLEKMIQIIFRLRDLGIDSPEVASELIDELHVATRLREESAANLQGTCVPEYSRLVSQELSRSTACDPGSREDFKKGKHSVAALTIDRLATG
jgi:hypothetical protein